MSNTKLNLTNLSLFLILNQVKWECKNNTVERSFEDGIFTIKVIGKSEEKNFSISIPVESEDDIKLHVPGMMVGYTINDIGNLLDGIRQSGAISPSVFAKYQESLELVGIPLEVHPECFVEKAHIPNAMDEAYSNFIKSEEVTRCWGVFVQSRESKYILDVAQIQDEHDNAISGRYTLYCRLNNTVIDLEVSPESLKTTVVPIDQSAFIAEYLPTRDPKADTETDYKRIIGNEKPLESEAQVEAEDKTKYLFPVFEKLSIEDIANIIVDECNNKLTLHTVVTALDFDAEAIRIAIASPARTWLNLIVALKDDLLYFNHTLVNSSPNFKHAVKIDDTRTLATIGASQCNIGLIRALVQNFVMTAPINSNVHTQSASSAVQPIAENRTGACLGPSTQPRVLGLVTAEQFVSTASSIFHDCSHRVGNSGYKSRWDALNELMLISGLEGLTQAEMSMINTSIFPTFTSHLCTIYDLFKVIKSIRPKFIVKGSLPTDYEV